MRADFKLAVAQAPADLATPRARLAWLTATLPSIKKEGADLLLLPELFAIGYNIGSNIPQRAEPLDGPIAQSIQALARAHGIAIHYGYAEQSDDLIYNSAQCFGADGARLGGHRKLMIPPGFEHNYFTRGDRCTLFAYRGLQIATLICFDAEFPETARHVASLGADLILVPTALGADWGWVAQHMIPTRAYENGVYLAYANSAGTENDMTFLGQSLIASPDGEELARAGSQPEILYATLDTDRVKAAQTRLPYHADRAHLPNRILRATPNSAEIHRLKTGGK